MKIEEFARKALKESGAGGIGRRAVFVGVVVPGRRGPSLLGLDVTVSEVWDVVRRLGMLRAMERFGIREMDVFAVLSWRAGYIAARGETCEMPASFFAPSEGLARRRARKAAKAKGSVKRS